MTSYRPGPISLIKLFFPPIYSSLKNTRLNRNRVMSRSQRLNATGRQYGSARAETTFGIVRQVHTHKHLS
jgi:hypothetical protein